MVQAVLFDIDGTLLDTTEFILQAYEHTLQRYNITNKTRADIIPLMGKLLQDIYQVLAPAMLFKNLQMTHDEFQLSHLNLVKPYPYVKETLQTLKTHGIKIAAITNRTTLHSVKTLELGGLIDHIDLVISQEDVTHPKPNAEPLIK